MFHFFPKNQHHCSFREFYRLSPVDNPVSHRGTFIYSSLCCKAQKKNSSAHSTQHPLPFYLVFQPDRPHFLNITSYEELHNIRRGFIRDSNLEHNLTGKDKELIGKRRSRLTTP